MITAATQGLRVRLACVVAGTLILGGLPEAVGAQSEAGVVLVARVTDEVTHRPLYGVELSLLDPTRLVRTDTGGRAIMQRVASGMHSVRLRRVGYVSIETELSVYGDTAEFDFVLRRTAAELERVTIEDRATPASLTEFEVRRRMGVGHFLTDSILRREGQRPLANILASRFPGLTLVPMPPPTARVGLDLPADLDAFGSMHLEATQPSGLLHDGHATCPIDTYVDGIWFTESLATVPSDLIAAVELYDKGSAPSAYRRPGKACKVLLIWTHR